MSELINNREHRQKILKEVIKELHEGKTVEEVKAKFAEVIKGVSAKEISEMEVQLVKEGLPIEEIQNLCDVHAAVFKGSIEEIHHPEEVPGHPIYTMRQENKAIEEHIENVIKPNLVRFKGNDSKENIFTLIADINLLWDIDKHYSRKENLIFPYLEKYGITAPPKVMWGVDDEIRAKIKDIKLSLTSYKGNKDEVAEKVEEMLIQIKEMIFKEDSILFPMCLDTLTEDEWISIYDESDEIGYALIAPEGKWNRVRVNVEQKAKEEINNTVDNGYIKFETGILTSKEINYILNTIPGDMTFVDKDNIVKYFSQGKERIFARTKAVIGRSVENCHPPASVNVVDKLVDDLRRGKKDSESFWIKMGDKYILISYFAVRDENGEFLGTLEFSQDIAPIQAITGEKRLMSE
ncbi:DUF438 domain-containing protein [Tissierella carlieri]|uniref:DUF438 domain-containing protein n=1 Tax=Tissierella carlieri TaxID=689904 RepID=A0ABT1SAE7_9FIRM|nr:DUF438 domain-containing protein [Tissierella carlieri]MBU5312908.1 DUF438 domain-containing protein [Tissierella carlieri]MCQ4923458.1 DUF438 domain-containing protein [Tissierella carlieri]